MKNDALPLYILWPMNQKIKGTQAAVGFCGRSFSSLERAAP
jgi:hypothetical protein